MSHKLMLGVAGLVVLGCEGALAKTVSCTMASLERTVELRYEIPGETVPCEIIYAKPTEGIGKQVLWRAEREAGYCEARFGEFVDKLRGFGWSCSAATADATDDWTDEVAREPEREAVADEPEAPDTDAEEGSAPVKSDPSDTSDATP